MVLLLRICLRFHLSRRSFRLTEVRYAEVSRLDRMDRDTTEMAVHWKPSRD
jgi:hypothetical protein